MIRMATKMDKQGRVVIPAHIRKRHPELQPNLEIFIEDHGNKLIIHLPPKEEKNQ